MQLKFERGKRALIIVAHPDDETIWMGGFILKHPGLQWTIFSLCRASDQDRAPKFRRICKLYSAKAIITDLEDNEKLTIDQTIPIIKKLITTKIGNKKFNFLFTHGTNGEYDHPRHIGVQRAVKALIKEGKLNVNTVLFFNYKRAKPGKRPSMEAKKDSDFFLRLSKEIFLKKKHLHSEIHGYAWGGIDVGYCTNPEAFKVKEKINILKENRT